jgi:hypothetical protein
MGASVTFVRTDEPSPMHEVALNLFCTDFADYVDVYGSAVLIGPGLALTARHNVEIFRSNFEKAAQRGEATGPLQMFGVQTWLSPPATVCLRVRKWFTAPWTDLAVLSVIPANEPPPNYVWRCAKLDFLPPSVGSSIAAFGFDDVEVIQGEEVIEIRGRGVTSTGEIQELLAPVVGNSHHGWPRFRTNARFDGGMSGGPVMLAGSVCGVVSLSLAATGPDEEHASFVPLLWPAAGIEIVIHGICRTRPRWSRCSILRAKGSYSPAAPINLN